MKLLTALKKIKKLQKELDKAEGWEGRQIVLRKSANDLIVDLDVDTLIQLVEKKREIKKKSKLPTDEYSIREAGRSYYGAFKREIEQYPSYQSPLYKTKKEAYEWCKRHFKIRHSKIYKGD